MAFKPTPEHNDWLHGELKQFLAPRTLPDRLKSWIRNWSVAGSMITVCVAITILIATLISGNSEFRGSTNARLANIEGSINGLRALLTASAPTNPKNQAQAKELLAEVRAKATSMPLPDVKQAGESFLDASTRDENAWPVALDLIAYRTELNQAPRTENPRPVRDFSDILIVASGDPYGSDTLAVGTVPIEQAAIYKPIGSTKKPTGSTGAAFIIVKYPPTQGRLQLDGMHIRNVIFRDSLIEYNGGPALLENVYFVNCRFSFTNNEGGRGLGNTILTGRNTEALAQEAIGHLLEHEERFIEAVEKGLASLDRGEFVSHQELARRIEGLLQS
jgi:hypothetical protein